MNALLAEVVAATVLSYCIVGLACFKDLQYALTYGKVVLI